MRQAKANCVILGGFCCAILFSFACSLQRKSTPTMTTESSTITPSPSFEGNTIRDPLETKFFEGDPKGKEAWRQFINKGRYRLAQPEDFHFSDAAKRRLRYIFGYEWEARVFNPYTGGDINHDQFYHDYTYIVVDRTRNDSKRFGLVVFNEEAGDDPHTMHWLYNERNLSQAVFSWASSGLQLEEFNERGESTICYVTWDEKQQEYFCDTTPKRRQSSR